MREVSVRLPARQSNKLREKGKRSGGRGERESKRGEGRGMREKERNERNRKERGERKENSLLLIDIMKDFQLSGPFNLTLPLLIKEHFSFSGQHHLE